MTPGLRTIDLTPEELAALQRLFAAQELARQAYQDAIQQTLEGYGVDHRGRDVHFNPWTGRFVVPQPPETVAPQKAG